VKNGRFTQFRISNASVTDYVGDHRSESPSSLKSAHFVMVAAKAATESVLNEKRCKRMGRKPTVPCIKLKTFFLINSILFPSSYYNEQF